MLLFGDYHTHTKYSRNHHGKSTIEQNVRIAVEKGLKEIGITEHGFNHIFFGVKRRNIKKMRAEIDRLNRIYPIKVYLGIEANLISSEGDIDLTPEEQSWFDYVVMGYHVFAKPKSFAEYRKFFKPNRRAYKKQAYSQEQIEANTNAYIKAIKRNRINIISHLGAGMKVDPVKIAEECIKTGTMIELNGRRLVFTPEETQDMIKLGATFILDSDAHICHYVGECNKGLNWVVKNNIPLAQVANIDKVPNFVWRSDE